MKWTIKVEDMSKIESALFDHSVEKFAEGECLGGVVSAYMALSLMNRGGKARASDDPITAEMLAIMLSSYAKAQAKLAAKTKTE